MRCVLTHSGKVLKYPYDLEQLVRDNPNTSFPAEITAATMAEFGVYEVALVTPPAVDHTKNLIEGEPVLLAEWTQTWNVVPASQQEIDERVNAAWDDLRSERNYRLSACDWTQGRDIPDSVALPWAAYRQELRNLPQNTQDPFNPVWPVQPE